MRIVGEFLPCTDGEIRPVVRVYVPDASGTECRAWFLVDTGADRTVFTTGFFQSLNLPSSAALPSLGLAGVGGRSGYVLIRTTLTMYADDNSPARIQGEFAAFTDPAAADMSILGRDILDHFDVIVSRRRNEVLLLALNHDYRIERI
jgi:hypothetical protein